MNRNCMAIVLWGMFLASGCIVDSACYNDADCPAEKQCRIQPGDTRGACFHPCRSNADCGDEDICDTPTGRCVPPECTGKEGCGVGFTCEGGRCVAEAPLQCPEGMAPIARSFCIDKYEASRPDANGNSSGQDESRAVSRPGVLPWMVSNNEEADAACKAAGKSLCTEAEWHRACIGPDETVYAYGNDYDPMTCNSIDTFCFCDDACADRAPCPFPHCYTECGADFHPTPTGSFADCTNGFGVFDMNGNLWEHVLNGDHTRIRGGAFNCKDSKQLHRCDYIPGNWTPSAQGFRCCARGWIDVDGGVGTGESR